MEVHDDYEVDAHGDINLFCEKGWTNVRVLNTRGFRQLQGVNLNCLLRGLFTLYGYRDIEDAKLPGGYHCWEELLEAIFVTLTHLCSIDDIMRRIQYLVRSFIYYGSGECHETTGNILFGSFSFLLYWIMSFHAYLSDMQLLRLKDGICRIRGPLFDEASAAHEHIASSAARGASYGHNSSYQQYNSPYKETQLPQYMEELQLCRERFDMMLLVMLDITRQRSGDAIGLINSLHGFAALHGAPKGLLHAQHHSSQSNAASTGTSAAAAAVVVSTAGVGTLGAHQVFLQPNLRIKASGTWAGYEVAQQKEKLKESLKNEPQLKLEIFGGDLLLDASDEDEDDAYGGGTGGGGGVGLGTSGGWDTSTGTGVNAETGLEHDFAFMHGPAPVTRLPPDFNLLQSPSDLIPVLFQLDPLEVSRQWTLLDHALFCAIPLHSLIPAPGSNDTLYTMSRHKQMRQGVLGSGMVNGVRGFIDRFNALSTWVTYSVLQHADLHQRARRIVYFIKLAGCFAELANFNALMVILTALQQGCISRLKQTFENVPKTEQTKLTMLQKLMSGVKNYQTYRHELRRLSMQFNTVEPPYPLAFRAYCQKHDSANQGDKTTNRNSMSSVVADTHELIWKKDIIQRYKPDTNSASYRLQQEQRHKYNFYHQSSLSPLKRGMSTPLGTMRQFSFNKRDLMDNATDLPHYTAGGDINSTSTSSASSTFNWIEKFVAVVPHLGAHLAELASINEGNPDYLSDSPYLFNLQKSVLLTATLSLLLKMQQMRYNLTPIRCIMASINGIAKQQMNLATSSAAVNAKKMYALSEKVEPSATHSTMISRSTEPAGGRAASTSTAAGMNKTSTSSTNSPVGINNNTTTASPSVKFEASTRANDSKEGTLSRSSSSHMMNNNINSTSSSSRGNDLERSPSGRMKYRKSNAYDRILNKQNSSPVPGTGSHAIARSTTNRETVEDDDVGDDDEEEEEEEGEEGTGKMKLSRNPFKLIQRLTTKT